jgi:hypothetical protein
LQSPFPVDCNLPAGGIFWSIIPEPALGWAKRVRKQKTDRRDAQLILRLMVENRFPQIWVPINGLLNAN